MKQTPMIQCPKCSADISPDSKFCKSCGQSVSAPSQMPTADIVHVGPGLEQPSPHVARIISSDSIPAGGFTPGTILADRYRIIGLLGRGGMGEVYRADDLKLGQPVALKFLPPKLAEDPIRRERFFAEVRITRQLSHPNICRVYDIAEIEGRHFLSMEFIDGEDLASLLKRIGHLTNEKALDIARQLAAGLAAAHERGVLHRDLKPANIMLDGHGRVRITDFGLAIAVEDETQAAEIAGTPAYMAPEQLAGKGASVRSDMYSLGLVLYEIYTGKKAFTATTLAELREQKETHTPRAASEIREGIDPVVERLIRRCMERDPNARPSSVAQLALALPGGDPLAAALAAGETPSPEMVAASGSKEGLRPIVAWGLLAFIIVGTIAILLMNDRAMLHRRIPFDLHPQVLVKKSQEIIKRIGYPEKIADSAHGFMLNADLMTYIEKLDNTADRWSKLDARTVLFWYRQSPRVLDDPLGSVGPTQPNLQYPGEIAIMLDSEGRLVSFRAVPSPQTSSQKNVVPLDWSILFQEAGLDPSRWTTADSPWIPSSYADDKAVWQGSLPNWPGAAHIEAAAFRGKPVSFEVTGPWKKTEQSNSAQMAPTALVGIIASFLLLILVIAGGIFFARRNLKLGRGDRRTAIRLAFLILVLSAISMFLGAHYTISAENPMILLFLGVSLLLAVLCWTLYIAIEPFVRRRWPQVLISWTRLFSGDWRDPLVARDVFAGCAVVVLAISAFRFTCFILPLWLDRPEIRQPFSFNFSVPLGGRFFFAQLFGSVLISSGTGLMLVGLFAIMRILLKNKAAAVALSILIYAMVLLGTSTNYWHFAALLIPYTLYFFVMIRFGLLAFVLCRFIVSIFYDFPMTLDAAAWYSGYSFAALAIFAAIVLYAFRYSLGGRPLLAASRLDD